MVKNLLKYCRDCKIYTLQEECRNCGKNTNSAAPPRFSIQDHYGKYRRMLKKRCELKE